jgi:hypothetical protein
MGSMFGSRIFGARLTQKEIKKERDKKKELK